MRCLPAAALALLAAASLPAVFAAPDGEPDLEALRARLAQLESEQAEAERHAREFEDSLRLAIDERKARRRELAEEVLTLELERGDREARARELEDARDGERERAAALGAFLDATAAEGASLAEQLTLLYDGIPGAGGRAAAVAALRGALAEGEERAAALPRLPALLSEAHDALSTVRAAGLDLRTASGRVEQVELLRAGNLAFAYRTGDRIGLALASPSDASGFRWTESVEAGVRASVDRAFAAVRTGAGLCEVPMDASGMLRVDSQLDRWTLARVWESGGPVMWPLAAVALFALLLVLERGLFLAREGGRSDRLLTAVLESAARGDLTDARERAAKARGLVARGLSACLGHVEGGTTAMEDGFQEQMLHELPRLERSLSGIGTLAAVAPLLGLLGTVTGIIQTFGVIRIFGNANPGLMAGGIAEALVTTATGLVIAIPTLLAHSLLRSRLELLTSYAEESAATLLNRLRPEAPS